MNLDQHEEHRLLNPDDPLLLRFGNGKRWKPVESTPVIPGSMTDIERMKFDNKYQDEDAARQDEWLRQYLNLLK
jgi:hypothetical protein